MSQDVEDLLAQEGHSDVDALMDWARQRADSLVPSAGDDGELGPLLQSGGVAGDAPPSVAATPEPTPPVEQSPPSARREPSHAAPLPPIPVTTRAVPTDELELDEIEELDVDELELLEDVEDDEDEDTNVSTAPEAPADPPAAPPEAPEGESSADEPESDAPPVTYGPPDGNEVVPEWKAALMSTQTETDAEAAAQVEEASSVTRLPEAPPESMPISARLEAEEDEISQHSVDLSDLDTDDA